MDKKNGATTKKIDSNFERRRRGGKLQPYVNNLKKGSTTMTSVVRQMIGANEVEYHDPKKRPSHIVLV